MPGSIFSYRLQRPAYLILLGLVFASSYLDDTIDAQLDAISEAAVTQLYTGMADQKTSKKLDEAGKKLGAMLANPGASADPDMAFEDFQRAASEYAEQAERNARALEEGSLSAAFEVIGKPMVEHAWRQPLSTALSGAIVLFGILTLPFVAWMVFARVRDIGWPVYLSVATLAPLFVLRLFGAEMSDAAYYTIQYAFFGSLVALGFVPRDFGDPKESPMPDEPEPSIPMVRHAAVKAVGSRPKTFGHRS